MALFFFFNNKRARRFHHTPIYWSPERDALEQRVERIQKELQQNNEITTPKERNDLFNPHTIRGKQISDHKARTTQSEGNTQFSQELHSSIMESMKHLSHQEEKGISGQSRWNEIFRIIIVLLLLGFVIWLLYIKK